MVQNPIIKINYQVFLSELKQETHIWPDVQNDNGQVRDRECKEVSIVHTAIFQEGGWAGGCPIRFPEMYTDVLVGLRQSISISVK